MARDRDITADEALAIAKLLKAVRQCCEAQIRVGRIGLTSRRDDAEFGSIYQEEYDKYSAFARWSDAR